MYIFDGIQEIKAKYGIWNYKRSSGSVHKGIDISPIEGNNTTVGHSTVNGVCEYAGIITNKNDKTWEWGYHVRIYENQSSPIRKKGTIRHTFAHNEKNLIKSGEIIKEGQNILIYGDSGNAKLDSQGKHVHYQVDEWNGYAWINKNPTKWCGGDNTIKPWGENKNIKDDNMYRLYNVVYASLDKKSAEEEFMKRVNTGERVGFDRAGSDGRYRVGKVVAAVENPAQLLDQLDTNYFIG